MTRRHTILLIILLLAPCSMFNINCPMVMAQEEGSVPATDSIKALSEPREPDSLAVDTAALLSVSDNVLRNIRPRRDLKSFRPDPIRSMWLGLVLPGAGQIYNRKYWKLPIIYGGFLGCVYALTWNSQMLSDYSQAYLDIMDSDPGTKSYEKMLPPNYSIVGKEERFKGIFKSKRDTFRRFRDLSIFAFGGVYLLSVIDAYVDAELSTFDISHDLSMQVLPTMIETERFDMHHRTTTPGVQCVINF